jgi:hypothetical protein
MPIHFRSVATLTFVALALAGCGKSPEAVCKKMAELSKDKDKKVDECVTELTEIKKTSPAGYDCIAKCSESTNEEAMGLCMFACIASDKDLAAAVEKQGEKEREKRAEKDLEKMTSWTKAAPKTFEGKLKDISDKELKFSIDLIEGFKAPKEESSFMAMFDMESDSLLLGAPSVMVSQTSGEPQAALDLELSMKDAKDEIVKKDVNASGFTLITAGESSIAVQVATKSGDNLIKCRASMYSDVAKKKKDDFLPWLEKICRSVKLK